MKKILAIVFILITVMAFAQLRYDSWQEWAEDNCDGGINTTNADEKTCIVMLSFCLRDTMAATEGQEIKNKNRCYSKADACLRDKD